MAGLKILACQIDVSATNTTSERDRYLDRVAADIRTRLQKRRHDLVVLPELSSIDYSRASFDNLDLLAEPLEGPSLERFGPPAREFGVTIVYGIPRRGVDAYYICQVVVDDSGDPIGYFDIASVREVTPLDPATRTPVPEPNRLGSRSRAHEKGSRRSRGPRQD